METAHTTNATRIARAGNADMQYQGERSHIKYRSEFRNVRFKVRTPQNIADDPLIQKFTCKLNSMEIHMGD